MSDEKSTPPPYLKQNGTIVLLTIYAAPRASRDKIIGEHGGALKIAITAPPVDGKANDHLISLLADLLKVARSAVSLHSGATNRRKVFAIKGVTLDQVGRALTP